MWVSVYEEVVGMEFVILRAWILLGSEMSSERTADGNINFFVYIPLQPPDTFQIKRNPFAALEVVE